MPCTPLVTAEHEHTVRPLVVSSDSAPTHSIVRLPVTSQQGRRGVPCQRRVHTGGAAGPLRRGSGCVQPRFGSHRGVATLCAPVAPSHHAPRHVNEAGGERCCAPIIEGVPLAASPSCGCRQTTFPHKSTQAPLPSARRGFRGEALPGVNGIPSAACAGVSRPSHRTPQ